MFDLAAFKAQYRALATAQGIDAADGPTSYQAANVRADRAKAAARAAATDWWADCDLWRDFGPAHSDVEHDTFRRLFWAAWSKQHALDRPLSHREAILRPLRDVHHARGERLAWLAVGKGLTVAVVVRENDLTTGETGVD